MIANKSHSPGATTSTEKLNDAEERTITDEMSMPTKACGARENTTPERVTTELGHSGPSSDQVMFTDPTCIVRGNKS